MSHTFSNFRTFAKIDVELFFVDTCCVDTSSHCAREKRVGHDESIQKRTKVNTANGKVQTNQEATVIVSDLDLIVAVHLLEDTLPVLSHAQLCEDHG